MFRIQDITLDHIIAEKKKALKDYCSLQKSSVTLRQTYLEELADACAAVGNNSRATEL
jgi:hypothetical protein